VQEVVVRWDYAKAEAVDMRVRKDIEVDDSAVNPMSGQGK
jgi:hypothetical protein